MFSIGEEIRSSKYVSEGVRELTIVEVHNKDFGGEVKDDRVVFKVKNKGGEDADSRDITLFFTENAIKYNEPKVAAICNACLSAEQINTIQEENFQGFVNKLNSLLRGKSFRGKISAREYKKQDGSIGKGYDFPLKDFAESITDGTVKEKMEKTEMTFDYNNPYDYKKLEEKESIQVAEATPVWPKD